MLIRVELDDDGAFVATDSITDSYGVGVDAWSAVDDLRRAMVRHFSFLKENADTLSPRFEDQLRSLPSYV